jgi:Trp operon repressor
MIDAGDGRWREKIVKRVKITHEALRAEMSLRRKEKKAAREAGEGAR